MRYRDLRGVLASSVAVMAVAVATPAVAQVRSFDIPAQSAATGIPALAKQADIQLLVSSSAVSGKAIRAVKGRMTVDEAVRRVVGDADLQIVNSDGRTFTLAPREMKRVRSALEAPVAMAAQEARAPAYDEIIVTAQKKEESIQLVPISVSAFSADTLDEYKIEGGSELLRAIPNVTFSKSNFASYNFSIRGIGTKALAAASDPAVAISFNNTPLIRNRLFEQEYFDVERVEVLRGPQGTLYGRNATGGVVNMITNKPKLGDFDFNFKGEVGNYETKRLSGMVNLPVGDHLAIRAAGAMTKRNGFDFNTITNNRVNGRDLWSTRVSAAWEPSDRLRVNAVWEHFEEDDNRSRTGKQLCHNDPGPTMLSGIDLQALPSTRGILSQACLPGSLYSDGAYGVPNGLALPYVLAGAAVVQLGYIRAGINRGPRIDLINRGVDPYAGVTQSRNLREIATEYDPVFRAKNDVYQLNAELGLSDSLKLFSQTAYTKDFYYSSQDYSRFPSNPIFNNSAGLFTLRGQRVATPGLSPDGILSDPQLGESDGILGVDLVQSKSEQYYQEFRLVSETDGPFNFSIGGNYTRFNIDEDYYVFNNLLTAIARGVYGGENFGGEPDTCWQDGGTDCPYIYVDPNLLAEIDGEGHNYFRSINIAKTTSWAYFGEAYWNIRDDLKITVGLRHTDDRKTAYPFRSQLLLGQSFIGGGYINKGFRPAPEISQNWKRFSGRAVLDWQPELSFTNSTLVYASYAKGYKGGGANPPAIDADPDQLTFFAQPETFKPENVNAFELGSKNSLMGGKLILNGSAFYYDYKGYQISQIVDRLALNENFDAEIWGAELEAVWRPIPTLRFNSTFGYMGTRLGKGMKSIDVMNRTQGNEDWVLVKPWIQLASNCIAPKSVVAQIINKSVLNGTGPYADAMALDYLSALCGGRGSSNYTEGGDLSGQFGIIYNPLTDAPNEGRGFNAPLEGNELPNSPRWTLNVGAQYTLEMRDWGITLRGDYYHQGKSWSRVYNAVNDRLKDWGNANISVDLSRNDGRFGVQLYVKNIFNSTPITDTFINSDDSGLTTNVFTLDPRIFGLNFSAKI